MKRNEKRPYPFPNPDYVTRHKRSVKGRQNFTVASLLERIHSGASRRGDLFDVGHRDTLH